MSDIAGKKDRSPSFPFIPLRRAIERAEEMSAAHKREATRLTALSTTWGYGPKSSGLQQTVAALKQFGLVEDSGSGEERRIKLSELARKIMHDARPGAREEAVREAAQKPRLFAEYIDRWGGDFPDDRHCISELELDRGFNADAARTFVKVLRQTIAFAGLEGAESLSSNLRNEAEGEEERMSPAEQSAPQPTKPVFASGMYDLLGPIGLKPLMERLSVATNGNKLTVHAELANGSEIDKLIRILAAHKALLDESEEPAAQ